MCGRYAIAPTRDDAWASVASELGEALAEELAQLKPRYNIPPSLEIPVIIQDPETREFRAISVRWGFIPFWWKQDKLPNMSSNARSESAAEKPMWRDAWKRSRCLIPATHWYEWQEREQAAIEGRKPRKIKQPYAHTSTDGHGFMLAGLWARWQPPGGAKKDMTPIVSAAIITRDASESVAHVHDRMPVVLHPRAWTRWLSPDVTDPHNVGEILAVNAVLKARTWPVSREMSKPVFSGPECLDPIGE